MESVAAALIGLGWWGDALAQRIHRVPGLQLASCYARTPETRAQFATEHGCTPATSVDEILEDPTIDAVLIATPHTHHRELVEATAEAGKHIFVEKPLTLTVEDGRACIDAAERAGVVLQVGHHRRRSAANRRLRALVDGDELGVIHHLEATQHVPKYQEPPTTWRADPAESPAGAMAALGVHMVDTFQYLAGPITRVSAYSKRILGRWELDDATSAIFEFASGPVGSLSTSLVLPRRTDVSIYGTEQIGWSEEDGSRLFVQTKAESARRERPVVAVDELHDQLDDFARCCRTGQRPETGGREGLAVVAVYQALVASVEAGRSVDVPELPT